MSEETAYDKSVDAAKEVFRKEARERKAAEMLEQQKAMHKKAARVWFDFLDEIWPPEMTEAYWEKTSLRLNDLYNVSLESDNILLQKLLIMMHEYLADIAEKRKKIITGEEST